MKSKKTINLLKFFCLLTIFGFMCLSVKAQQVQTVKLYPKTLRIEKGKAKSVTAVGFDSGGNYVQNINYSFTSNNTNIVTLTKATVGNFSLGPTRTSKNLAEARTSSMSGSAGTTTIYATFNGINSNPVTVVVDNPAASPVAVIHGDNDATGGTVINTKVGEPIEVDAESSSGVKKIKWHWGDGDKTNDLLSATHAYLQAGTYQLQLTITNSSNVSSTANVTVNVSDHLACTPSNTITVSSVSALQTQYNALTSAGGKCILLAPGVYDGNLELEPKNFSEYVTIGTNATLPDIRNRIAPDSSSLITIRSSLRNTPALYVKNGTSSLKAGKLRFIGIKFDPKHDNWITGIDASYIARVGNHELTTQPYHNPEKVIFQHCVLNPPDNIEVAHGLQNDGYKSSVISSWMGNIKTISAGDSQAVFSISGRGAHVYNNTFFEAASESIMYGGTGCISNNCAMDGVVPSNIEMRRSFFFKRLAWRTDPNVIDYSIKNLFETKTGRRIYAEGNVFKNHYDHSENQTYALKFKSAVGSSSSGYLWNITEDVVFENNRISHIMGGISTLKNVDDGEVGEYDPLKLHNLIFRNNLFDDVSFDRWGQPDGKAWVFSIEDTEDFTVENVTVIDSNDNVTSDKELALYSESVSNYRLKIINSIVPLNLTGIKVPGCGSGITALNVMTGGGIPDACTPVLTGQWTVDYNVFPKIGNATANNPQGNNQYPADYSTVGLKNYQECLTVSEACEQPLSNFECVGGNCNNAGSNGKDVGADIAKISKSVSCTESGIGKNCRTTSFDYDYDGKADISVFRPLSKIWYVQKSSGGTSATQWGNTTDTIAPADFDGDGKTDVAVFRPTNGQWFVLNSLNNEVTIETFGTNGDIPVQADYDGDGKADIAVFRPTDGTWYVHKSSDNSYMIVPFGTDGDKPAVGDYDADGKADLAVFRPMTGVWYLLKSTEGLSIVSFGANGDKVVAADYDGDRRTDIAVWRGTPGSNLGTWHILKSGSGYSASNYKTHTDLPSPADFDGDGKTDIAVFRPSNGTWYIYNSSTGTESAVQFGADGDIPTPTTYVH